METENRETVALADSQTIFGNVVVSRVERTGKLYGVTILSRAELQAIVQQAHDRYGITADPFATRCEGSGNCRAALHTHGCFADRDGTACDDPEDHADTNADPVVAALVDDHSRCRTIGEWYGVPVHAFAVAP